VGGSDGVWDVGGSSILVSWTCEEELLFCMNVPLLDDSTFLGELDNRAFGGYITNLWQRR